MGGMERLAWNGEIGEGRKEVAPCASTGSVQGAVLGGEEGTGAEGL
jgi:hypothetical protein